MRIRRIAALGLLCLTGSVAGSALAQTPAPAAAEPQGLFQQDTLLGDWGGLRGKLANAGITFGLQDTNEVWANASGGRRRATDYDGQTMLSVGLDTAKAGGWDGGIFNVSALQIRGRNLVTDATMALQLNSNITASPTTRLWEAWYQQTFANGMADLKIGQQSLDLEFMTSQGASLFLNAAMGWPMQASANMYAGGPAYPLSSLGARLRVRPDDNLTLLGGVFQDNPPGGPFAADSQLLGSTRWGGNFNLRTGALAFAEAQYAFNQPTTGPDGKPQPAAGLPGTYKLGVWYDSAAFPSPRYDMFGDPLAETGGTPRTLRNNWSVYALADQAIWRPDPAGVRTLAVFVRAMGGPGDRNLIDFSMNAGLTLKAPLPERDDDTLGLGFGVARLSGAAVGFDQDINRLIGPAPVRSTETFLELTYQAAIAPWWQLQPDFQYIFRPGGGIANPNAPGKRIGDAAIFGLRSVMLF